MVRYYNEAGADGKTISGHGNDHKLLSLPTHADCSREYLLSSNVLGHVRVKPAKTIRGQVVERMYREAYKSDRKDLIAKYEAEMEEDSE